jgi:hypothetical protein
MAEPKTKANEASVSAFLNAIKDEAQRKDAKAVAKIMKEATGDKPLMWGTSIVGFGSYHYKYASGREGDWPLIGFSPRSQALTLYIMDGFKSRGPLLKRLGKHKTGKSCLYIKRLSDVDMDVLRELVRASLAHKRQTGG